MAVRNILCLKMSSKMTTNVGGKKPETWNSPKSWVTNLAYHRCSMLVDETPPKRGFRYWNFPLMCARAVRSARKPWKLGYNPDLSSKNDGKRCKMMQNFQKVSICLKICFFSSDWPQIFRIGVSRPGDSENAVRSAWLFSKIFFFRIFPELFLFTYIELLI